MYNRNEKNNDIVDEQIERDTEQRADDNDVEREQKTSHTEEKLVKQQRLHPAAIYFNLVKVIKETIFGLGLGLILTFKESMLIFISFVTLFLLLLLISSIVSWFRFTYRVEENELRIEQGVFIRKKRYISINRIHKIDLSSDVIHRLFKLTKVQIDTASSGDGAEVNLSAVSFAEGVRLRRALEKGRKITTEENKLEDVVRPAKKISWTRLFFAGTTSGSVGFIFITFWIGFSQIEELIPRKVYNSTFTWMIELGVILFIILLLFGLLLLWLIGIAGTMIKYGNFTIEKREKGLFIKRGLLETKELTIPYDRIQAIGIEQNLIRQPFKFVRVFAVVAGGSFDNVEQFPVLFPIMRKREVAQFLEEFVPTHTIAADTPYKPLAKRGLKYYLFSASVLFIVGLIPVIYYIPTYSWIVLILLAISLAFGWLKYKETGYHIEGRRLTLRMRRIDKVIITTYHRRIQALEKSQHRLQRIEKLASLGISLIGSGGFGTHYTLKHLTDEDANEIAEWYSYRKQEEEK